MAQLIADDTDLLGNPLRPRDTVANQTSRPSRTPLFGLLQVFVTADTERVQSAGPTVPVTPPAAHAVATREIPSDRNGQLKRPQAQGFSTTGQPSRAGPDSLCGLNPWCRPAREVTAIARGGWRRGGAQTRCVLVAGLVGFDLGSDSTNPLGCPSRSSTLIAASSSLRRRAATYPTDRRTRSRAPASP